MFNLVGKNLKFPAFKTSFQRLFPRSLCSSPAASDNSFRVSYLIHSFGFPPDKAISASKYLKFKTPDRADSVIAFFKHQGFTETQICKLVQNFPLVLNYHPQRNLLPKFDFLSSTGLLRSDVLKLFTGRPELLGRSLKNHIEPNYISLRDMLQSNDRTLDAIRRCAWVLDKDSQANLNPNMQILRDVGVPASNMLYTFTYHPRDFLVTADQFKETVEEVVAMGFNPLKISFVVAVHVLRTISKSTWEKKMEAYKKWGWSEAQILLAFRAHPWCMVISEEKIDKVMDYLVNKMGVDTSNIAKSSIIISYSLEKRIIPRCLVYQFCLDKGLIKDKKYFGQTLTLWLKFSESMLIKRLERYEEKAPGVLKFYQEKLYQAN